MSSLTTLSGTIYTDFKMERFLELLAERRPEYEVSLKDFIHPLQKNKKFKQLTIDGIDTSLVMSVDDLNSENVEELNELISLTLDIFENKKL